MEHIVTGCKNCIFEYEMQGCFYPNENRYKDENGNEVDFGEYMDAMESDDENAAPSWCPLAKEPITIIKK